MGQGLSTEVLRGDHLGHLPGPFAGNLDPEGRLMEEIARFDSRDQAEIVRNLLISHDIAARVSADDGGRLDPNLAAAGSGISVLVPPEDADRARRLLAEAQEAGARDVGDMPWSSRPVRSVVLGLVAFLVIALLVVGVLAEIL